MEKSALEYERILLLNSKSGERDPKDGTFYPVDGNVSFLSSSQERGNPYKVELSNTIPNGPKNNDKECQ